MFFSFCVESVKYWMLCFILLTVLPKSALCDFVRPALFYFWNWGKLEGSENDRSSISSFISKVSTQYCICWNVYYDANSTWWCITTCWLRKCLLINVDWILTSNVIFFSSWNLTYDSEYNSTKNKIYIYLFLNYFAKERYFKNVWSKYE